MTPIPSHRCTAADLAIRLDRRGVSVIDVREPMEYAAGHIPGSRNVPLAQLAGTQLPPGPLVLVCQSGNRSSRGVQTLLQQGHPHPVSDLEGDLPSWQQAGYPVHRLAKAPLPLMRQVQIAAGSLVLLGLILSQAVPPAGSCSAGWWAWVCWLRGSRASAAWPGSWP